jgi:hypothetical protein
MYTYKLFTCSTIFTLQKYSLYSHVSTYVHPLHTNSKAKFVLVDIIFPPLLSSCRVHVRAQRLQNLGTTRAKLHVRGEDVSVAVVGVCKCVNE